ncbi:MAG: acetyl xylan esterase [Blastopirellula sp.]|nr:MAG: acetyl xylan esterase [Blastopirellula sp.]
MNHKIVAGLIAFSVCLLLIDTASAEKTHLFILSGQSNMAGLDPSTSFTPTVIDALKGNRVIVIKIAQGGQPIRRWYKNWKSGQDNSPDADGVLYDKLMTAVKEGLGDQKPDTVTFVWMQGERDAKEKFGSVYAASLNGVLDQLRKDLKHEDLNFVIGRLSDFKAGENTDWEVVRKAQVKVAEATPYGDWVDTDDLNGKKDALHYDKPGYKELGKRFAEKSLALLKKHE